MSDPVSGHKPSVDVEPAEDGTYRLLIVAAEAAVGDILNDVILGRVAGRTGAKVHLVAPAITKTPFQQAAGAVDQAMLVARERMMRSLSDLHAHGIAVSGGIGDSDPILAIEDELRLFPADEIMIVTHPAEQAGWMEDDLFERSKQKFEPEITHVVLEVPGPVDSREGDDDARPTLIEHAEEGIEPSSELQIDTESENTPPMSFRDLAMVVVAIAGTLILILLAANSGHGDPQGAGYVVRYLLAGVFIIVNLAHIVALIFWDSIGYRGMWERLFTGISLYGTPLAIIVSLLVV